MYNFFETDLLSLKEQFKSFLRTQEQFKDFNFDGSGISELLNLLSFVTQYQNTFLNFNSNEQFLKTAQIKDNVYKLSHKLNYIPNRKSAAWFMVNVQRTSPVTIVIPKYSKWSLGALNLTNLDDITINTNDIYSIRLYEGIFQSETFISDGTADQCFELTERESIDNNNLFIYVDESDGLGGYIVSTDRWKNINEGGFYTGEKGYYLEYFDNLCIRFDNGDLFQAPPLDSRVRVEYMKTVGSVANGSSGQVLLIDSGVLNKEFLSITSNNSLKNGTDEETITSIQSRAPQFYTTQNRAVTERDYNILLSKYSYYDTFHSGIIWGGEKEFVDQNQLIQEFTYTKDVGKIYISAIKNDYSYLEQAEIDDIEEYLSNYKIITLFFKFLQPVIINISADISIKYSSTIDLDLTSIEEQINTFLKSNDGFGKSFYLSDVIRFVDSLNDVVYTTVDYSTSVTIYNEDHKLIRLCGEVLPNTILGTISGFLLSDDGAGVINWNGSPIGEVNYSTGVITIDNDFGVDSYQINFQYSDKNAKTFEKETFLKHLDIDFSTL